MKITKVQQASEEQLTILMIIGGFQFAASVTRAQANKAPQLARPRQILPEPCLPAERRNGTILRRRTGAADAGPDPITYSFTFTGATQEEDTPFKNLLVTR